MARLWRDYSLSVVLFGLFIASWIGQTVAGWAEFSSEQQQHGQVAQVFGPDGYVWHWAKATLENWQSEFLQLLTFVVLTASLIHKGSHESKDSDERMQASLDRIEQRLRRLEESRGPATSNGRLDDRPVAGVAARGISRVR